MKIFFAGEIVGKGGIFAVKKALKTFREEQQVDLVIANGEGATGGFGLGKNHSLYIHKLGVDVITLGEKGFFKKEMAEFAPKASFILRPSNSPPMTPGKGYKIVEIKGKRVAVISILGMSGFKRIHLNNPFLSVVPLIEKLRESADFFVIDFHAATTAEKYTMAYYLDGRVSAVCGTHTKAMTADNMVLPGGTGYITDNGRTGSLDSVGGLSPDIEINKFLTQIPEKSMDGLKKLQLQGALFEIDDLSGKCISVERIVIDCGDGKNESISEADISQE